MPNLHTHVLFAHQVQEKCSPPIQSLLSDHQRLFLAGANGPDFCFFHGLLPKQFQRQSLVRKLGKKMHRQHINATYDAWVKLAQTDEQLAYLLGHFCHWALDSIIHPHVYWRCGSQGKKATLAHQSLESMWDAMVLKVFWHTDVSKVHMYRAYQLNDQQKKTVSSLYVPVADVIYHLPIEAKHIDQAFDGAYTIQKWLHDPTSRKRQTIRQLEKLIGQTGILTSLIVPREVVDNVDIANLKQRRWCYPAEPSIQSSDHFFMMYDKAMARAIEGISLLVDAFHSKQTDQLLGFIANQSYIKGVDTQEAMKVFDPDLANQQIKIIRG